MASLPRISGVLRTLNGKSKSKNLMKIAEDSKSQIKPFSTTTRCSQRKSYIHNIGEQPLKYMTIGACLEDAANRWPDRPWIVSCEDNRTMTFSQILEKADKLAAGFIECGLKPGDRIGICSPNTSEWTISMMASARAGLILVTINPAYQEGELEYCLNKVGVKCLIIPSEFKTQNYYNMIRNLAPEIEKSKPGSLSSTRIPTLNTVVIIDDKKLPGTFTFEEMSSIADSTAVQNISSIQKLIEPDKGCNIQFTSGSTGKPKAAYLSHFNFVNNSFLIGKRNELSDKHHKICTIVPLFHAFGVVIIFMASLQHGSTLILPSPSYNPEKALKSIIKEKCTVIGGTPTMYVDIINKKRQLNLELTTPEIAIAGGSPVSPQLIEQIKKELNISKMKSVFGMTETTAVIFQSLRNETMDQMTQTVGHIQEHIEAQVVGEDGNTVPFGTPGELWVRGYSNMLGYWEDDEKTNETMGPDRWLKTGDKFILQEDGYGKIIGRLKDVIIRGGENIYPKEVEDFLNTHPNVLESQVFGVNDPRLGEDVCAGIRLKEGTNLDYDGMKKFCQGKIAHFKIPSSFESNHPKTPSSYENVSYFHNPGSQPLSKMNVGQAFDTAANNWPDRPFFVSEIENETFTYGQLNQEANKFAAGLLELGLRPGDRLGICSPNSIRWFVLMMAASKIGVISVAINPANQIRELEYCLNKVGVKALAIPSKHKIQNYQGMLEQLIPEMKSCKPGKLKSLRIPTLESIIMTDDIETNGVLKYKDVLRIGNDGPLSDIQSSLSPDLTFSILFTSGSTGLPKAAMQSHTSYLNSSWTVGHRCKLDQRHHKINLQIPLFHALGLLVAMAALQHGSTVILPSSSFNPDVTLKSIVQNECTILTGTPTMYVDMIKKQNESKFNLISPDIAVTGGAPCSPQLFNNMSKYLKVNSVKSIYGMTEACSVLQSMPEEDFYKATETVGKVMDHLEIKIVDKEGFIVPIGTPGELCIRGYSNMIGYWGDDQKTSEAISPEKWMKTGDQFIMESDGYAKISGRIKDVIIRGGENIFPKEIEDFLNTHPEIIETQVFGVKDDRLGEEICASVRVKDGSQFDYTQLKNFCKGAIAHFKIPRHLKIVDDFPKTASGKIQKFKLRELMENGQL